MSMHVTLPDPSTSPASTSPASTSPASTSPASTSPRRAPSLDPVPVQYSLTRLQREWQRLCRSPRALARANGWRVRDVPFESLDEVLRFAGFGPARAGFHGDDAALTALLLVARHDDLAARVVLQRVLPGIAARARRRSHADTVAAADELLGAAWTVIRTFPVERRPHYVAAGLLRRIAYAATDPTQRRLMRVVPLPGSTFEEAAATETRPEPADELRELLTIAERAGVSADEIELVRRLGTGATTLQLAEEANVTDRTIRNRRATAVLHLREVARSVA
ncbi:MAG: hypothetical protein F2534_18320 [Actinobacteria bacterium]|uniref:Unannotated protein n=1 Tax=freshwater metagenome TaxID=449393 RepID=A0A6J6FTI1_9ZZZZ|nr:hypothetical protein [Actinomycetota bacterium]